MYPKERPGIVSSQGSEMVLFENIDWRSFDEFAGTYPEPMNFPVELAALTSDDKVRRQDAIRILTVWPTSSLGEIGRVGAMPHVVRCVVEILKNHTDERRGDLIEIVQQMVENIFECTFYNAYYSGSPQAIERATFDAAKEGVACYLEFLQSSHDQYRNIAAKTLGLVGDTRAVEPLCQQLLQEPDRQVCQSILESLGRLQDARAQSAVEHFIDHDRFEIRVRAAAALCQISDPIPPSALATVAETAVCGACWDLQAMELFPKELGDGGFNGYSADLTTYYTSVIESLGSAGLDLALDYWEKRLAELGSEEITKYVKYMLMALFSPSDYRHIDHASDLSIHQARALQMVVDCTPYWTTTEMAYWKWTSEGPTRQYVAIDSSVSSYLEEETPLPATREGLAAFLGRQ